MWNEVIAAFKKELTAKMGQLQQHVESAVDAAIHSQSKMESRYDTYREDFSKEAAIADGYRTNYEIALRELGEIETKPVADQTKVDIGAIVKLHYQNGHEANFFLIRESAAGLEAEVDEVTYTMLSTEARLGEMLHGLSVGNAISLNGHTITIAEIHYKEQDDVQETTDSA